MMTIRWMEGASRLDTSRGSRFMRAEADENPTTQDTELELRASAPTPEEAADPQVRDGADAPVLPEPRQARASLQSADRRRNAG
jgi:hypothetical protein